MSKMTKQHLALFIAVVFNLLLPFFLSGRVHAAALTEASIRLDRMGAAIAANGTNAKILVVLKPASTATEAKFIITWPTSSAFTVNGTAANHTVTDTGIPATYQGEALVASGITSPAADVTAGAVTFTIPDVTAGTLYGFFITGGITNPSAGNAGTHIVTFETLTSGDVSIDTSSVAVDTVGTNADQVTVTATVPATFNFNISDTALPLGTLSSGTVETEAMTTPIDIDTNANNGYVAWIRSEGAAVTLASASTGDAISSTDTGSPVNCAAGTECYVVDVDAGTGTVATEYVGDADTGGVIALDYEQIASHTAPVANETLTLTAVVAISALNEAATDYTDTWEIVGAGNF